MSLILGIETSCDETAVAIYDENRGLLSHIVYSQIKLHKKYGGVVPELASRDHVAKLNCVVRSALDDANCSLKDLSAIAYTAGPGLAGALMVGAGFATSLAMSLNIAALPVHHLEAHISVSLLDTEQISYPFLALLVSGGHTQIILAHEFGKYEIIGETLDDAVGEAFDKSAKIMGLPYPGGREIERLALAGDPSKYDFPRPMLKRKGCDFSFSGLKTAVANTWFNSSQTEKVKADIAASFQVAVVESCCDRVLNAFSLSNSRDFVVAGGVAANLYLRDNLKKLALSENRVISFPALDLCTDNGAMVAFTGAKIFAQNRYSSGLNHVMHVKPRWPLSDLTI